MLEAIQGPVSHTGPGTQQVFLKCSCLLHVRTLLKQGPLEHLQSNSPQSRPRSSRNIHRSPLETSLAACITHLMGAEREWIPVICCLCKFAYFIKCKGHHKPAAAKPLLLNSCRTKIKQLFL